LLLRVCPPTGPTGPEGAQPPPRKRSQASRPLRRGRGRRARVCDAEGARARARGRLRPRGGRRLPGPPRPSRQPSAGRAGRRGHRGDARPSGAVPRRAHAAGDPTREAPDATPTARRARAKAEPGMTRADDIRRFLWLLRNYSAPYWWAVGLLLLTSYVGTALSALFPILMAPILDLALGVPVGAGVSGTAPNDGLSLTNLGPAFFEWVGIGPVEG